MLSTVPFQSQEDRDAAADVAVRVLLDGQCPFQLATAAAKASVAVAVAGRGEGGSAVQFLRAERNIT